MNVGFVSLGCSKNLVDTEMMIGLFKSKKYKIVNNPKDAEIIVVNTCGFIGPSKEEAINTLLEMAEYKKTGKLKYLIATGCLIERYKDQLQKVMPEIDLFIKFSEYDKLWEQIDLLLEKKHEEAELSFNERVITTGENYAYVRIAEGCDNFCTFCAIPYIRGRFRSRTEESIIDSVTRILAKYGHYSVSQFTSHTADRARVLREFEDENYDVLAAIKCFDEGVDVPKLDKIYIMASDALSRQTIQRRGRVLRTCTDTGKRIAYIYDFVALPPIECTEGIGVPNLVINEMRRAKEYARLADNKSDTMAELSAIMGMYGINEEDLENEFDAESE